MLIVCKFEYLALFREKSTPTGNFAVFDFAFSDYDMAKIAAMDIGHSEIVNHFDPKWIKALHGWRF